MAGPLEGIRIMECAGYLSAPSACYILGDMGAEIIKIEDRIKGDPARGMSALFGRSMTLPNGENILFETANRNKKSMTLDLKKKKGKGLLYKLLKESDVFCTNFSLSTINKLSLDYDTLKKYNPKLIYAMATGYGSLGPDSEKRAFDSIAQARSGVMYTVGGEPESPPAQIGGPVFDQTTGSLLVGGILAALIARDRQGIGQQIEVSLLGAGIHLQAYNINTALMRGKAISRPSRKNMKNPMANHYQCADGEWILLSEAQSDRFWHDFCIALGIEQFEKDERFKDMVARKKNYSEITEVIEKAFLKKTRKEWLNILEEKGKGMAFAPVLKHTELSEDSQVMENGYINEVNHPSMGKAKLVGSPLRFSETPVITDSFAPSFGEHTEDILINICGYNWDQIGKLRDEEII
ncbi:CaiB/BaiF CoA transferase family protein [Thermodesulfobacteriota bacterium]